MISHVRDTKISNRKIHVINANMEFITLESKKKKTIKLQSFVFSLKFRTMKE